MGAAARARQATWTCSSTTRPAPRSAPFLEIDLDEWDDVLATNLRGTYLGCRVVGAHMRERGAGRIVNLASVAGQNSRAVTGVHYASSKAAIIALTRHAATELAGSGVTVKRSRRPRSTARWSRRWRRSGWRRC